MLRARAEGAAKDAKESAEAAAKSENEAAAQGVSA
jgi:hypothetical protein